MGRIPDEDVQRVRDASDVVSVISDTVILKKKGRLFWGLCPFHSEKTPSFKVDPSTQLWHCFGCGKGGDVFGFLMESEKLEFPESIRLLADRGNIEINEEGESISRGHKERLAEVCAESAGYYHRVLLGARDQRSSEAREYLQARGFGIEVAKRWELGYAPGHGALFKHLRAAGFSEAEMIEANVALGGDRGVRDRFYERITFPIRDLQGRYVGFGGRILGQGEPKYLNTQETPIFHKSNNLYAIDVARNEIVKAGVAIVVEGYTDVIALHEVGVKNTVATLGTALTRQHVKILGRFASRIVYLFDGDEAGLRAADRAAEFIDVSTGTDAIDLEVAVVPEGDDPADLAAEAGSDGIAQVVEGAQPLMRFVIDRRLAAHDLSSPEGRSRALSSAAAVLASVKGSLLAQDYANYVADKLLVDTPAVMAAVEKARPEFGGRAASQEQPEAVSAPVAGLESMRRTEREYLSLMARYPDLRERGQEALDEGVLADSPDQALFAAVVSAGDATGTALVDGVSSTDDSAATKLTGLVFDDEVDDPAGLELSVRLRLKELRLERRIVESKARLKGLDAVKNPDEHDELFREIASLQSELESARLESRDVHE